MGSSRVAALLLAIVLVAVACSEGGDARSATQDSDLVATEPAEATSEPEQPEEPEIRDEEPEEPETRDEEPEPDEPTPVVVPTPTPLPTEVVFVFDPETGEPVETEVPIQGPQSLEALVDRGVQSGDWEEAEGLVRVLRGVLGLVAPGEVQGLEEVQTAELNTVLDRANSLARSGDYSEAELAELRRLYELLVPSRDIVDRLIETATPAGLRGLRRIQGADCVPVDAAGFSSWAVVEGCYKIYEDSVAGVTTRIIYPAWYDDDPAMSAAPLFAREALNASLQTYSLLATIGDVDLIFSLIDTLDIMEADGATLAVASDHADWGNATIGGACPVTVFPVALLSPDAFRQTIAHEVWHCVQREDNYPDGVDAGTAWYVEGGAEYFSNVVYPSINDEHGWLGTFASDSLKKPLFDMSYEAWIWWQFLANRSSPSAVANLQRQMMIAGDGGRSAMQPNEAAFHTFVVEYVAGTIEDEDGSRLPGSSRWGKPLEKVTKDDQGKELKYSVEPFVAFRTFIEYKKELRILESDETSTAGDVSMVEFPNRTELNDWSEAFPEVRSKCKSSVFYVLVGTTGTGTHEPKIKINKVEEASCDPCLLGTWEVDLETWKSRLLARLAPGTTMDLGGHYYIAFGEDGFIKEQRDGMTMTLTVSGQSITLTTDSFAEGEYSADGERIIGSGMKELFSSVTGSIPGFTVPTQQVDSSFIGGGAGSYECRTDDMTLTADGFDSIELDRVDKILEPPEEVLE